MHQLLRAQNPARRRRLERQRRNSRRAILLRLHRARHNPRRRTLHNSSPLPTILRIRSKMYFRLKRGDRILRPA